MVDGSVLTIQKALQYQAMCSHDQGIKERERYLRRMFHKPSDEKRMVVILPDDDYDSWLTASPEHSQSFMRRYPAHA